MSSFDCHCLRRLPVHYVLEWKKTGKIVVVSCRRLQRTASIRPMDSESDFRHWIKPNSVMQLDAGEMTLAVWTSAALVAESDPQIWFSALVQRRFLAGALPPCRPFHRARFPGRSGDVQEKMRKIIGGWRLSSAAGALRVDWSWPRLVDETLHCWS